MAASSSGGRSEIWQRVDRRDKGKDVVRADGSVPVPAPASDAEVKDGVCASFDSEDEGFHGVLDAERDPSLLDQSSKDKNDGWIPVTNRKNKKNVVSTAQGNSLGGKVSGRSDRSAGHFGADRRSKGADWRPNFFAGAVPNHARKVFDRRAQRPKASVVINPVTEKRSWLDVCAEKRKISSFLEMNLVSPLCEIDGVRIADVPSCLVDEAAGRWKNTLVGFVLGDVPFFGQILAWARRSWRTKQEVRVFSKENGFFFFQFGNDEDRDAVLRNGPWLFDGRLVVLQRWGVNVGFDRDFLSTVPVWIRIPHLPLHLWSAKILSIITSVIGSPICLDRATASMDRIAYARCLVEVNADLPLVRYVLVRHEDGKVIRVEVEYEGEPPRCSSCLCFGHTVVQCSAGKGVGISGGGDSKATEISLNAMSAVKASGGLQGGNVGVLCKESLNVMPHVEGDMLAATRGYVDVMPHGEDKLLAAISVKNVSSGAVDKRPNVEDEETPHVEDRELAASSAGCLVQGEVEVVKAMDADQEELSFVEGGKLLDTSCKFDCGYVRPSSCVDEQLRGSCNGAVGVAKSEMLHMASSICKEARDCHFLLAAPSPSVCCKEVEFGRKQMGDRVSELPPY